MSDGAVETIDAATETAAPAPPAAVQQSAKERAESLLDDKLLAHLMQGREEEPTESVDEAASEQPAEAEAKPDDKKDEKDPEKSAEVEEWTPEKITAAAAKITEERASLDADKAKIEAERRDVNQKRIKQQQHETRLHDREQKLNHKVATFKQEKAQHDNTFRFVGSRMEAIRTGDGAAVMDALGHLSGRDPVKLYEEISLAMAGKQRASATEDSPLVRKLLAKIEAMESRDTEAAKQREQQTQAQADAEHTQRWKASVVEQSQASAAHPVLARFAQGDPEFVADEAHRIAMSFYQQNGQAIDRPNLLNKLNEKLIKLSELSHRDAQTVETATTASGADTELGTVASAAKPAEPQRTAKGQSIPQSLGSSGRTRPATPEERKRRAADLLPDTLTMHIK